MKIACIGDPHGVKIPQLKLQSPDLILITGDLGDASLARERFFEDVRRKQEGLPELEKDVGFVQESYLEVYESALEVLKYYSSVAPVYFTFGNADLTNAEVKRLNLKYKLSLPFFVQKVGELSGVKVLNNRFANFKGLRVGGLSYFVDNSWIKEFNEVDTKKIKTAGRETKKANRILQWFGKNSLDILLCHQPPYGILDCVNFPGIPKSWRGRHAGSRAILGYIRKYSPETVLCGHIHEGQGRETVGKTEIYNLGSSGTFQFLNL